jgi:hypothetical protein
MKYKSIKEEARRCRARLKDVKVGDPVMFCHHDTVIEILIEPPENRIRYIATAKLEEEQAVRFHWFGPVPEKLWKDIPGTRKAWEKAREKAWEAREARSKFSPQVNAWIAENMPDCPWNGTTLFPKEET